ncbi:MAG: hypothetical protein WCV50_06120 [Patescibacteria group bacterium]|jgi:hypothetical protein
MDKRGVKVSDIGVVLKRVREAIFYRSTSVHCYAVSNQCEIGQVGSIPTDKGTEALKITIAGKIVGGKGDCYTLNIDGMEEHQEYAFVYEQGFFPLSELETVDAH